MEREELRKCKEEYQDLTTKQYVAWALFMFVMLLGSTLLSELDGVIHTAFLIGLTLHNILFFYVFIGLNRRRSQLVRKIKEMSK